MNVCSCNNPFIESLAAKMLNQELVDFYFKFSTNETIGVHSVVLAAQSDVFDAMFTGPMKEKSPVTIKDISKASFTKLIHLMYNIKDKFEGLEEALDVYEAAHKYNCIDVLEFIRKEIILNFVSLSNANEIHNFASFFEDAELQKECVKLFHEEIENFLEDFNEATQFSGETVPDCEPLGKCIEDVTTKIMESSDLKQILQESLGLIQVLTDGIYEIMAKVLLFDKKTFKLFLFYTYSNKWENIPNGVMKKENKAMPKVLYTRKIRIWKKMLLFKFSTEESPKGVWILVHKKIICAESTVLADIAENAGKEYEMKDFSFNIFKKIINLMYNLEVELEDYKVAIEFYETSKKINFERGVEFSRYIITTRYPNEFFTNEEDAAEIFKFGKHWNDEVILDRCLWYIFAKNDMMVEYIFDKDDVVKNILEEPLKIEKNQTIEAKLVEEFERLYLIKNIQEKIIPAWAFLKTLMKKLNAIIDRVFQDRYIEMRFLEPEKESENLSSSELFDDDDDDDDDDFGYNYEESDESLRDGYAF